ncbi:hypothetical protein ILYODFUR_019120 [Ilyodon furcidens]|uniref:Uncharacterized protein n=1 Tax=Ilyodon furcidens TaxID=33524 RepID=A0ABV0U792_9TELE
MVDSERYPSQYEPFYTFQRNTNFHFSRGRRGVRAEQKYCPSYCLLHIFLCSFHAGLRQELDRRGTTCELFNLDPKVTSITQIVCSKVMNLLFKYPAFIHKKGIIRQVWRDFSSDASRSSPN